MIQQLHEQLLRVFRIALHDASDIVRSQVCRATLKEIAAKYFLWGDALGLQGGHLELRHIQSLQNQIERNLCTMADLIVHIFQPGIRHFVAHDLLSSANEATTGSLAAAETSCSSSPATQHDEDAGAQYADHEMDQLLEDIDFRISCLLELSPLIQRCTEHDDAEFIPLPAVPDLSLKGPQYAPETPEMSSILEERNPRAPKELLGRLYNAKARRDATRACTDFGICTFDDCRAKYRVFEGTQWAHHEFDQHRFNRSWTCLICQQVDLDELAWLGHLLAAHLIDLEGSEMVLASKLACQVHPRPVEQEKCSFCREYPANTREDFVEHVGDHFQAACELIAAHSLERTQPRSSENTALPHSPTEKIDSPLDTHPQSRNPSPDFLGQGPFASDPEILDRDHSGDSILLPSGMDTPPPSRNETTDSALDTGSQNIFPASSVQSLPPPKARDWQCGNCIDRPMMTLNYETHCSNCNRRCDAYSVYYDKRGRKI